MLRSSSGFRSDHLYRKRSISVFILTLLFAIDGCLQPPLLRAQKKRQSEPRSLAVVAWNGDSPNPNPHTSVLTPVAILVEGRYYDANLYQAQPEPLAVDSGVVYDVLQNGDPIGTFTVGGARNKDAVWYGTGLFEPKGSTTVQMSKSGAATARKPAASASSGEDDRPRLRRGIPPPPAPKQQTDAVLSSIDRDPQRPTLRRHTAEERKAESQPAAPPPEFVPPEVHALAAVSDAGGPEPRSFAFRSKAGELDEIRAAMEKLARAELDKLRKLPPENKNRIGKTDRFHGPTSWPLLQLQDAKFGVFDVNSNNAPIVVYSAAAMVDGTKKYVSVAAWEEIDQSLRKVFAQVTDDHHLDVYPRLEVVDAVDSTGNGRGELLFRAFGDQGSRWVLYHPGPDSLNLLFDSAHGES